MSRAQLNKSLKAFGHPPIAEQAAQLMELQRELDEAERALAALQGVGRSDQATPTVAPVNIEPTAKADKAALNRAKIQLAMRRAALAKAQSAELPPDQVAALIAEVAQAEQALQALEAS